MVLVLHNIAGEHLLFCQLGTSESERAGSVNHADILLLPRVLVSGCETGLVSRAARCVTLLRPHFLFVMAAGYFWSGVSGCWAHTEKPSLLFITFMVLGVMLMLCPPYITGETSP